MSQADDPTSSPVAAEPSAPLTAAAPNPADTPIPLWPEGVLALLAGGILLVIGFRHRIYLHRKYQEVKRAADEFQRQGGVDDLSQVARQVTELLKPSQP